MEAPAGPGAWVELGGAESVVVDPVQHGLGLDDGGAWSEGFGWEGSGRPDLGAGGQWLVPWDAADRQAKIPAMNFLRGHLPFRNYRLGLFAAIVTWIHLLLPLSSTRAFPQPPPLHCEARDTIRLISARDINRPVGAPGRRVHQQVDRQPVDERVKPPAVLHDPWVTGLAGQYFHPACTPLDQLVVRAVPADLPYRLRQLNLRGPVPHSWHSIDLLWAVGYTLWPKK